MKNICRSLWLIAGLLGACASEQSAREDAPHWQLSPQYVHDTMLKSDASIAEALKYKQIALLHAKDLPAGVYARYRAMAERMHIRPLPALYLDTFDMRVLPHASARLTRKGRRIIIVNPSALSAWTPRQFAAVLGHELVHLKENHVTAENIAQAYNHPELSVAHEFEADRIGSGPLGSCDPRSLKQALEISFSIDRHSDTPGNSSSSPDYLDNLISMGHPNRKERLAKLDDMAEHLPEKCRLRLKPSIPEHDG